MKKISTIRYFFKEAILSLIRNRLMSFASFVTVASCVLILTISFCIASNIDFFLSQIERTIGVTVIISSEASTQRVNELFNYIENLEHVKSIKYVSSDEALKQFSSELGDTSAILGGFENDNPLPRSFTIDLESSSFQADIVENVDKLEGVESVRHAQKEAELLTKINNSIRIISALNFVVLGLVSIIVITNTIKITVNSRRTEISIMKFVGATNWFIRWPFIIEGVLIGAFGAAVPVVLSWFGYSSMLSYLDRNFTLFQIVNFRSDIEIFTLAMPIMILLGILIGAVGSIFSIRKYLQV